MGNTIGVQESLKSRPLVVIVGGGIAGIEIARVLDSQFNVLLIDKKDHFFFKFGPLRAAVDSSFTTNLVIPFSKFLKYGYVLQAEVTEVLENGFKINGKEDVFHFDYMVICTGSNYPFPLTNEPIDHKLIPDLYIETEKMIQEAKDILIVGGGPIGVELAGEIAEHHPDKNVTIVSSRDHLVPGDSSIAFREKIYEILKGYPNMSFVFGERVVIEEGVQDPEKFYISGKRTILTNKGTEIPTDLIFLCNGPKVNNSCYKNSFAHKVNDHGQIMVNEYLQVEGQETIFACGDCANVPEIKNGRFAYNQSHILAQNIINHYTKNPLKEHKPWRPLISIPIGMSQGAIQFPNGFILGSFLFSMGMGRDLGASRVWKLLNVKNSPESKTDSFFSNKIDKEQRERFTNVMKLDSTQALNLFGEEEKEEEIAGEK